jgi:hypothetical protein
MYAVMVVQECDGFATFFIFIIFAKLYNVIALDCCESAHFAEAGQGQCARSGFLLSV